MNLWTLFIVSVSLFAVARGQGATSILTGLLSSLGTISQNAPQNGAPPPQTNFQGSSQVVTNNQAVSSRPAAQSLSTDIQILPQSNKKSCGSIGGECINAFFALFCDAPMIDALCAEDSDTCCIQESGPPAKPAAAAPRPVQITHRPTQAANRPVQAATRPVQNVHRPAQTPNKPVQRPIPNRPTEEVTGEGVASWLGTPVEVSPPVKPLKEFLRPAPATTTTRRPTTTTRPPRPPTTRATTTRRPTTRQTTTPPTTTRRTTTTTQRPTTTPRPTTTTPRPTTTTPRPTTAAPKFTVPPSPLPQPQCESISGICIAGAIAKYCKNIVNGHCDGGKVCCRNKEPGGTTTTGRPITLMTTTTEEALKLEPKLPPCPGKCISLLFSFVCSNLIPDVQCEKGRVCCASSPDAQTTKPPAKYCKGFCIPKHITGVCHRPARLVADTVECDSKSLCCDDSYKETPILRPTESRPSAQKPLLVPSNNLRPDKPQPQPVDRFEEVRPPCPGKCISPGYGLLQMFICAGKDSVYNGFSCDEDNLVCCAPKKEIEKYEAYLSQNPNYRPPRPQARPPLRPPPQQPGPDPSLSRPRPIPRPQSPYHPDETRVPPPTQVPVPRPDAAIPIPHYQARPDDTFSQLDTSNEYSPILDTIGEAHRQKPTRPNQRPVVTVSNPNRKPSRYVCGKKGGIRYGRVIGGSDTKPGEWCWQVALINSMNQYLCGGALIGSQWVLTAAHCVTGAVSSSESLYVRVGDHDLASKFSTPGAQTKRVYTTYIHHNHNSQTLDNDIALLKLDDPVDLNDVVCLICLPARGVSQDAGKNCTVTGYGYQHETGPAALKIREAVLPIVEDQECTMKINKATDKLFILPLSTYCAGGREGHDACQGDGGGPMSCLVDEYWELTGIVSWGFGCGRKDVPGVYVKVSTFIGWINQIISVNI